MERLDVLRYVFFPDSHLSQSVRSKESRLARGFISKNSGSISKALGEAKNLVRASSANRNQKFPKVPARKGWDF